MNLLPKLRRNQKEDILNEPSNVRHTEIREITYEKIQNNNKKNKRMTNLSNNTFGSIVSEMRVVLKNMTSNS